MEHEFWHERWESNDIAFHEGEPNALLVAHFEALAMPRGSRIFVPLCGKSRDIHWLLNEGFHVAGAELSESAIRQLFDELDLTPSIKEQGPLKHFSASSIDIFVGDIFAVTQETLGKVDAVYDRAALVALPEEMRTPYTKHLRTLSDNAPQLLVTLEYEKDLIPGPPFSVQEEEVRAHYNATYSILALESRFASEGLKGKYPVTERVWRLQAYLAH